MFRRLASYCFLIITWGTFISHAQEKDVTIKLEHLWTIDGFDRPESLIPNTDNSEIYVSNINGPSSEVDGNGYISRLSPDGQVIEKKWITGLDGPKGFALDGRKIYITDVKDLVVIDVDTKEIINRIPVPNAGFLNDVAVVNGIVFFSDTGSDTLYRYSDEDGLVKFAAGEIIDGVNGLLANGDDLLITVMRKGHLVSINLDTRSMNVIGGGIVNGDGIGILSEGGYTITSFSGEIYHVKNSTETELLLDSKPEKIAQNDSYLVGDTLYVANLNPGSVTAWKIVKQGN